LQLSHLQDAHELGNGKNLMRCELFNNSAGAVLRGIRNEKTAALIKERRKSAKAKLHPQVL
jgi:hypothetical protein